MNYTETKRMPEGEALIYRIDFGSGMKARTT